MAIVGIQVCKSLGGRQILENVSIEISGGQITVLTGPSGGGKTTLIRALSLLDPPSSGSVSIEGITRRFPGAMIGQPWPKVTVVFQQLFLWPHLTLRQNIELPLRSADDRVRAQSLIEEFDMLGFVDRHPNEASVGQRQRAAIARALALRPSFILLDEITSALDVEQIAKVHRQLVDLKARGIGILIVTHLLDFAKKCADRVYFLDAGRVVEAGDAEILEHPRTERLREFLSVVEAAR